MELILMRSMLLHSIESISEFIFSSNCMDPWQIVDSLMKVHPNECLRSNGMIRPTYIPILFLRFIDHHQSYFFGYFSNNRIIGDCMMEYCTCGIDDDMTEVRFIIEIAIYFR